MVINLVFYILISQHVVSILLCKYTDILSTFIYVEAWNVKKNPSSM